MLQILQNVGEEFGALRSVAAAWSVHKYPEEYRLVFEYGLLAVSVDDDLDTVVLSDKVFREMPEVVDLSACDPWRSFIGTRVRWCWALTNHRGFSDGVQFEFVRSGAGNVQLIAEASALRAFEVSPKDLDPRVSKIS